MWEIIIGIAAIVAAIAAAVGVWLQFYWRRPDLALTFRGFSATEGRIDFAIDVRNDADQAARDVRVVFSLDDEHVDGGGPQTLTPYQTRAFGLSLARPQQAEVPAGGNLTLHGRTLTAQVKCGRRSKVVAHGQEGRLR